MLATSAASQSTKSITPIAPTASPSSKAGPADANAPTFDALAWQRADRERVVTNRLIERLESLERRVGQLERQQQRVRLHVAGTAA